MQYKNEQDFSKAFAASGTSSPYLLYGDESYLIEAWTKKLLKHFVPEADSFNMQRISGQKLDCDELCDAVETLPLMATEKCVLVDGLELKSLPASEMDKLAAILSDVPESCNLIITGKPGSFDGKSAAGKKVVKLCSEHGCAIELGARAQGGLVQFLQRAAKQNGCELPSDTARYILQVCETDMQNLSSEIHKICAFAGSGNSISRQHVDAVAIQRTEARVFDLSKAILARNSQQAFELLANLFYLRESEIAIVSVLIMAFTDMYRAAAGKKNGDNPAGVAAAYGLRGREFRIRNAWNTKLSLKSLHSAMDILLSCDRRMKSTSVDSSILLEQTVVQLLMVCA